MVIESIQERGHTDTILPVGTWSYMKLLWHLLTCAMQSSGTNLMVFYICLVHASTSAPLIFQCRFNKTRWQFVAGRARVGAAPCDDNNTIASAFSEGGRIIQEAAAATAATTASARHRAEVTMATGCWETAEREAGVSGPSAFEHQERLAQSKILNPAQHAALWRALMLGGACVGVEHGGSKSSGDARKFFGQGSNQIVDIKVLM